ncbi:hypothetical protein [Kamptonema formosum]|uniref:hypothetical protein n=1 Tax=Kamptonema formosum TaxID=331992 RepID=UPI0012DCA538|nr:hypothetical protein [Oscillatoria sp. PCC 10802]
MMFARQFCLVATAIISGTSFVTDVAFKEVRARSIPSDESKPVKQTKVGQNRIINQLSSEKYRCSTDIAGSPGAYTVAFEIVPAEAYNKELPISAEVLSPAQSAKNSRVTARFVEQGQTGKFFEGDYQGQVLQIVVYSMGSLGVYLDGNGGRTECRKLST